MAISYDKNTDYQAKINEAIAKGDKQSAMQYEAQRNAKIEDMNKAGTNTGNYDKTYNYKEYDGIGLYDLVDKPMQPIQQPIQQKVETKAEPKQTFNPQYSTQLNDLISAISTYQNTQSMSRDEANARAYSQLNNVYNANLDKTLNNYNINAIQRGMFGQLPTEALKQNAISESELNKSIAINDLANNMYTQDFNMARQQDQDYFNKMNNLVNLYQQGYNVEKDLYNIQQNQQDKAKNEWINNIGQFSNDYMAEINRITNDGDTSNDWQIPYLTSERNQKISNINQSQATAEAKLAEEQYNKALNIFKTTGQASGWVADVLGFNGDAQTLEFSKMLADNARANKQSTTTTTEKLPSKDVIWKQAIDLAKAGKPPIISMGQLVDYQPTFDEVKKYYIQLGSMFGYNFDDLQNSIIQQELEAELSKNALKEDVVNKNLPGLNGNSSIIFPSNSNK